MTLIKELPLLFQPAMAAQTALGNKTQTRRKRGLDKINESPDTWVFVRMESFPDGTPRAIFEDFLTGELIGIRSPYGAVGGHLWVRETWQAFILGTDTPHEKVTPQPNCTTGWLADEPYRVAKYGGEPYTGKWRPSLHMPRWASRLTLEVTDIRIERIQDITEEDAIAEGITEDIESGQGLFFISGQEQTSARVASAVYAYKLLFDLINGPEFWQANKFVWVVTYKVVYNRTADRYPIMPVAPEPQPEVAAPAPEPVAEPAPLWPSIAHLQEDTRSLDEKLNEAYERGLGNVTAALSTKSRPKYKGVIPSKCINDLPTAFVHVFNQIVLSQAVQLAMPHFLHSLLPDEARLFKHFATVHLPGFLNTAQNLLADRNILKPSLDENGQPLSALQTTKKFSEDMADLAYECLFELNQASDPREPQAAMVMFNRYGLVQEVPEGEEAAA